MLFSLPVRRPPGRPSRLRSCRLEVLPLESRVVPYGLSGNSWLHPELVSLSFVPDGTDLGGVQSNLISAFNARFGSQSAWQSVFLRAAQHWAKETNLNFTLVSDNGAASGSGSYQQGDPGFGDIRVGGWNMNGSTLATAFFPQPTNNYSVAGDMGFNTGNTWNINGQDFDLFTVAMHEFGHSLGLSHSLLSLASMYSVYNGLDTALNTDDVLGIRTIYSLALGRAQDSYDSVLSNGSFSTASNVTSAINPTTKIAQFNTLDLTTGADVDFYKVTAPAGGENLTVRLQSQGLSLLSTRFYVYNGNHNLIGQGGGAGNFGVNYLATIDTRPGKTYFVKVVGAESGVNAPFNIGSYGLVLNFGTGSTPTIPPPNTQELNGDPPNGGGGIANRQEGRGDLSDTFEPGPVQKPARDAASWLAQQTLKKGTTRIVGHGSQFRNTMPTHQHRREARLSLGTGSINQVISSSSDGPQAAGDTDALFGGLDDSLGLGLKQYDW